MANNSLTGNSGAGVASLSYGAENSGALKRHHHLYNNTGLSEWLPGWKILSLKVSKELPLIATAKFKLQGSKAVCGFTHGFPYQALLKNSTSNTVDAFVNNVTSAINYGWVRTDQYSTNFNIINGRNIIPSIAVNDSVILSVELNNGVVIYRYNDTEAFRSSYTPNVDLYLIGIVSQDCTVRDLEISGANGFNINEFNLNLSREIWIPCQEVLDVQPRKPGSQFSNSDEDTYRTNIQIRASAGTTIDIIYPNGIRSYQFTSESWYTIPEKAGDNFTTVGSNFVTGIRVTGNYTLANITGIRIANPQIATQTSLNLPNSVTGYESTLTNLTQLEIWGIGTQVSQSDSRKLSYAATTVGTIPRLSSLTTLFLDSTCDVNDTNAAFSSGVFRNLTTLTFFDIRARRDNITKHYPEFCALRSLTRLEINLEPSELCVNSSTNVTDGLIPSTVTNVNGIGSTRIGLTTLENFRSLYRNSRTTITTGLIINQHLTETQANQLIIAQISVKMLYGETLNDSNFTYVHRLNSPGYQLEHSLYYAYNRSRFTLTNIPVANGNTGTSSSVTVININTSFTMLTGYTYNLTIGSETRSISSTSGNTVTLSSGLSSIPANNTAWTIATSVVLGDRIVLSNDSNTVRLYIAKTGTNQDDFNVNRSTHQRNFQAGVLVVISTTDSNTHYNARQLFRMTNVAANTTFSPEVIEGLSVNNQSHFRWDFNLESPKKTIALTNVAITGSTNNGDILTITAASGSNLLTQIGNIAIGDTIATAVPSLPLSSSAIPSIVINKTSTSITVQKGNISNDITTSSTSMTVCYGFTEVNSGGQYYGNNFKSSGNRVAQSRNSTAISPNWTISTTDTSQLVFSTVPGLFYDNFSSNSISGLNLG